ncbi:MAG: DUF4352 domain-containing protein [Mucilaginibacter sp.]
MNNFLPIRAITLLLATAFLLSGCYTTYNVVSKNYNYDDDIAFTIDKVQEGSNISTGNGSYYAKRGFKFIFLFATFKNASNEEKKLDFSTFYLLEPKSHTRYKVDFAMMESVINIFGSLNSKIQKNDTKSRRLVFSFPKDEKAEMLEVNGKVYNLSYAN